MLLENDSRRGKIRNGFHSLLRGNGFGSLNPPKLAGIGAVASRDCRTSRS
jgi:hypothetical protein